MTLDDLKRLFSRKTLFRLDALLSPKLMPIVYATGLAALLLWAINHLFASFANGFGNGLWGLLEIAVFGLLMMLALRVLCEALLVYFKSHEATGETAVRSRYSASLLDEVRDAIRDLAEEDDSEYAETDDFITPATDPVPRPAAPAASAPGLSPQPATRPGQTRTLTTRTARRTPAPRIE